MKKLALCLLITMLFLVSGTMVMADPIAVGDQVLLERLSGYETNGGPFAVSTTAPGNAYLFTSFCLERNEWVDEPLIVSSISIVAVQGGIGGQVTATGGDPISDLTAYLYYTFRQHTVTYDLNALQYAIWYLEDEYSAGNPDEIWVVYTQLYGATAAGYISDAQKAYDAGWRNDNKIGVMNLKNTSGIDSQSQLTMLVPEPMSLLLLGIGLVVLGFTRKFKKIFS